MKKLIIATITAGFISLGFTLVDSSVKNKVVIKAKSAQNMDLSSKMSEKRLASWD
jgi:hypothetical protein